MSFKKIYNFKKIYTFKKIYNFKKKFQITSIIPFLGFFIEWIWFLSSITKTEFNNLDKCNYEKLDKSKLN